MTNKEAVNHPDHYMRNNIEAIDIIEAMNMGYDFCIGNVIKYVYRAGKKDKSKELEDLRKANWYLSRAIQFVEQLKLPQGNYNDTGDYIVRLNNSDEYMKYYNRISTSESLDLDDERTSSSDSKYMTIVYVSDEFDVILDANMDEDYYTITVTRGDY